ncbi:MAG: CaiB/BaiF CoA-transferase family protein [Thermoproteota archaeon]|jgi:formyl-CoA transferase/CoA:oxalate CoA-transferase|nr:CaiB/BaiF CoA-transferase family protein [Thermoproteota archaeon]
MDDLISEDSKDKFKEKFLSSILGKHEETLKAPLDGIIVTDLTHAAAGPFTTMLLSELGAKVIKIESLMGDQTRKWAPFVKGMSSYFMSMNKNKYSIAINLKKEEGKEILKKLIKISDVFIENFQPGVIKRLGFGYDDVSEMNRSIIYCSISGYGQYGPWKEYPAYDLTILATSGHLSITGEEGRPPVKFGVAIADLTAAFFATIAIISALYKRLKTGQGEYIDISMFDANLQTLTYQASYYFATHENPKRLGSAHPGICPYQAFEVNDGYVVICVGNDKMWQSFCKIIDREDLINNPKFKTNELRVINRQELVEELSKTLKKFKKHEIVDILIKAGIPAASILSVKEALENEHTKARKMVKSLQASYGDILVLGSAFKFLNSSAIIAKAPPMLGEDTDNILKALGYSEEQIRELKEKGIINPDVKKDIEI